MAYLNSLAFVLIGFFAVSYSNHAVVIVNLRGPDVILREGFDAQGTRVKKRRRKGQVDLPAENSLCLSLNWCISGVGNDTIWAPRLVAMYEKG